MLKWNVKIQKFNTDAISLTEKWSQNPFKKKIFKQRFTYDVG